MNRSTVLELTVMLPRGLYRDLMYLSDKRSIPIEAMTRDAIVQYLREAFAKEESDDPNKYV